MVALTCPNVVNVHNITVLMVHNCVNEGEVALTVVALTFCINLPICGAHQHCRLRMMMIKNLADDDQQLCKFQINPLPYLKRNELYQCVYNNSSFYNVTLNRVNKTAATVKCLRPADSALSSTPNGKGMWSFC